ncbi:MAG: DUF883 family protein [Zoogloea sp.]|nr:DUF883 family protein [Zoogloea sp.]
MQTVNPGALGSELSDKAATGMERLSSTAHEAVDRATDAASSTAKRMGKGGRDYLEMGSRLTESTRTCVRDHPLASVGVAVGVGLLISLLTRISR